MGVYVLFSLFGGFAGGLGGELGHAEDDELGRTAGRDADFADQAAIHNIVAAHGARPDVHKECLGRRLAGEHTGAEHILKEGGHRHLHARPKRRIVRLKDYPVGCGLDGLLDVDEQAADVDVLKARVGAGRARTPDADALPGQRTDQVHARRVENILLAVVVADGKAGALDDLIGGSLVNAARHVGAGVHAGDGAGRRNEAGFLGDGIEHLHPGVIHGSVGGVHDAAVFDHIVDLDLILGNVKNGEAVLLVLAVRDQRNDNLGNGDAGDCDDACHGIFDEGLDAGALAGTLVLADVGAGVDLSHRAVAAAGKGQRADELALTEDQADGIGDFGRSFHALDSEDTAGLELFSQIASGTGVQVHTGIDLGLALVANGNVHLDGVEHSLGNERGIDGIAGERLLKGDGVFKDGGDAVELAGKLDEVALGKAGGALSGVNGVALLGDELHLALVDGGEAHENAVAPLALICRAQRENACLGHSHLRVLGDNAGDEAACAAVGEELLHRVGQIAVLTVGVLAQVAAELPLEVREAGHERGRAHRGALHRHADKACGACANAFDGTGGGIVFLHIDAGREILSHSFFDLGRCARNLPPFIFKQNVLL